MGAHCFRAKTVGARALDAQRHGSSRLKHSKIESFKFVVKYGDFEKGMELMIQSAQKSSELPVS